MELTLRTMLALEQRLTCEGDMTRSLFKKTAELLREGEFQRSLEFVAARKNMRRYRDMIDFLFCELVLGFRADCMRFYAGQGHPLRKDPRATPERIAEWDIFLAASLHIAHAALEQNQRLSWEAFRKTTEEALRMTG